jgi:addiction module HigA family antidote
MRTLRDPNRRPTHPGAVLREDVLPDLGWTQGELAARLLVSRVTVSDILHEKKSITAEMAVRISRALGGSPESWLRMQDALDIWQAEMKFKNNSNVAPKIKPRHTIQ